jgi:mono/diheme cytochrome c family protein
MKSFLVIFLLTLISIMTVGHAQTPDGKNDGISDSATFALGGEIYNTNCAVCHQPNGAGAPPDFPSLAGNANLADIRHAAVTIRTGRGKMLAFPQFTDSEIAAVLSYVRNSWENHYGTVTANQLAPLLANLSSTTSEKISVWRGIYTEAQNKRGAELHSAACAQCHGLRLNGAAQPDQPPSPAIARTAFLRKWTGQTVAALFGYIRYKMPPDAPDTLTDEQTADAIAHMLAMSSIPTGENELPSDSKSLETLVITEQEK